MNKFNINDTVICIDNSMLKGNDRKPNLEIEKEYIIEDIILDKAGNQHIHVGLKSDLNYITSYETREELPKGNIVHWCHPSRFKLKE
jgi:hypothetical protein